ncbi:hypothetical protein EUGRSUZ_J03140 [Eucalyptus grandis]|uniref:Uncharacterized protein n=2 Tax=Eucalyptus grandis TaxID=71139 RepID=A0ACC3JCC2_EUCGR|nr:hypothetical protein EUGRSUZ_J03140 [Eucalyptus grandis]
MPMLISESIPFGAIKLRSFIFFFRICSKDLGRILQTHNLLTSPKLMEAADMELLRILKNYHNLFFFFK